MVEGDFRDQLGRIRQRIQQKKESSKKYAELFEESREEHEGRRKGLRDFSAAVRELEKDKRILGAVSAHFDIIPQDQIDKTEEENPQTASSLYALCEKLIRGEYGPRLQANAQSLSEEMFHWEVFLALLLLHCSKSEGFEGDRIPEVFDQIENHPVLSEISALVREMDPKDIEKIVYHDHKKRGSGHKYCSARIDEMIDLIEISPVEKKILLRLFRTYLDNLVNPSSFSVKMMLKREQSVDKAMKEIMKIKNKKERAKSIDRVVDKLLGSNRVEKAFQIVGSVKAKQERERPLTHLINGLLNPKRKDIDTLIQIEKINDAIQMADSLADQKAKDKVFQRIVSGLANHKQVDKALEVAEMIKDPDIRDFALSSMVSGLVAQGDFSNSIKVALMIRDNGFREDAHSYIVRGLLESKPFNDVIAFVEKIEDPIERTHAAKIILSSVRSNQDQKKIDEVCSRFELISN